MLLPASLLFMIHQFCQKWCQLSFPFADQYLDPLLCMPILLGIWQLEQYYLYKRTITAAEAWVLTALLSILFEVGFPRFSPHFTADWIDAVLYFSGTALFLLTSYIMARAKKKQLLPQV